MGVVFSLTISVLKVLMMGVDHVLSVEGLADLTAAVLILTLSVAVPGAISHPSFTQIFFNNVR